MNDNRYMNRRFIMKKLPLFCFILSLTLFLLSMVINPAGDVEQMAEETGKRLSKRMELLDSYIGKVQETGVSQWSERGRLPDDMVIYRYVNDSLLSWNNQFSVFNDDISSKLVFQRMTSINNRLTSPLSDIETEVSYMNIGPKWYVTKAVEGEKNDKILAGLEIKNTLIDDLRKNENGVNPALKLPAMYSVLPLNNNGGAAVCIGDIPLFKIIPETNAISTALFFDNTLLKWLALILFALASVLHLHGHRKIRTLCFTTLTLGLMVIIAHAWAQQLNESHNLFSPTIYADGQYLNSLGVLIMTNCFIVIFCICCYMVRNRFMASARSDRKYGKVRMIIYAAACLVGAVGIFIYTDHTLSSLIMNSNITMELYRWNTNIPYTIIVYLSYVGLMSCILLQLQAISPIVKRLTGIRYNVFTRWGVIIAAFLFSLYFTVISGTLGFRKEQDRVSVWANRLAVDRNLALEIQLRSVEDAIASDQLLSAISMMDNTSQMLQNRISENYLYRIRQSNTISVHTFKEDNRQGIETFNNINRSGTPISQGSRFHFMMDSNGRSSYAGTFFFWSQEHGLVRMLLVVEPNSNREDRGYYSILGRFSQPGEINIPYFYSYAKYIDSRLVSFKGNYPYPTVSFFKDDPKLETYTSNATRDNEYVHFTSLISENEMIMISRKQRSPMAFFTSFSYLFLIIGAILMLFVKGNRHDKIFKKNFFRKRINTILFTSSLLILASMAIISVLFVYKRNETNMYDLMSTKINTIQALSESRVRHAGSWQEIMNPEIIASIENIGTMTKSDITFYTPEGKVFHSTTPEIFEKQILGSRINEEAFWNIKYKNQRFFIHREKIADYQYWMLYAPVFNDEREMIGIISSPYTDRSYDFRREAFSHTALIINLFLMLLIGSLLFSSRELNRIFLPLVEMGKRMNKTDIHNPEYIIYKREDEISTLVDAYNRMQNDLARSTKMLASAERDKAWSEMARQVAHEIKNPLTPIKLEIQRLIRLKQKGNPAWEDRFDKVADVVLEHIDILTDTANEFSTFAKLYSEDPVLIDLDKTLKEQLLIFDNKEDIRISYLGMSDAFVMAPKPQLIRVFVNLITNAIQAVEMQKKESGDPDFKGMIVISLRNSTTDGYYDIVVDDNGPGVKEENMNKLFTPNFTTKTGGTGLGLAICRNIITKCDGDIRYQKSFALGGASFTVSLPKHKEDKA